MVQEDKLRVGPRNMLHHQVMAEVVTVKERKLLEYFKYANYKQTYLRTSVNGRVFESKDTKEGYPGPQRL